jgi:hypothetical protein
MIKKLEKLKAKYGPAQVCVWLGVKDTRTLNTWLSRGSIPFHMEEKVKQVLKEQK